MLVSIMKAEDDSVEVPIPLEKIAWYNRSIFLLFISFLFDPLQFFNWCINFVIPAWKGRQLMYLFSINI